jgi:hypothetical protein
LHVVVVDGPEEHIDAVVLAILGLERIPDLAATFIECAQQIGV